MQVAGTDLRLLRVFDAVVRHRGFAAAQAELNIGQSTISNHISALEDRLGVTLCQRGRAGFQLTERGKAAYAAMQTLLMALDAFSTGAEALRGRLSGTLRLGVVDSVVTDPGFLLPEALATFEARNEAVQFEILPGSPQALQTQVLEGGIHLAIGSFPHKIKGLVYSHLYDELNTLYCASGHSLFGVPDAAITAATLTGARTAGRSYWRPDHRNNQNFANTTASAQGVEQQLMLILSGAFIGYLPDQAAVPWVAAGRLRQLRPSEFSYICGFDAITRQTQGHGTGGALAEAFLADLIAAHEGQILPAG